MKKDRVSRKEIRKAKEKAKEQDNLANLQEEEINNLEKNKSSLHDLLAPSGIDATHYDYLEIFSKISRFARTFYITTVPRQATFPYFLAPLYEFGDANTSVYITPIAENSSIKDLNKTIVELESERVVANNREDINRHSVLGTKQPEAEELRDQIPAG